MGEVTLLPWCVIVLGRWNRSILTPAAVARRLLGVPEGDPLEVEIPVNVAGVPRVKRSGVTVMVEDHQLFIEVERESYGALERAIAAAAAALEWLPHTPVHAVGINVTFPMAEVITTAPTGTNLQWDKALTDGGYEIVRHIAGRSLKWGAGRIMTLADRGDDGSGSVLINFERRTDDQSELRSFLKQPVAEFRTRVEAMLVHLRTGGVS